MTNNGDFVDVILLLHASILRSSCYTLVFPSIGYILAHIIHPQQNKTTLATHCSLERWMTLHLLNNWDSYCGPTSIWPTNMECNTGGVRRRDSKAPFLNYLNLLIYALQTTVLFSIITPPVTQSFTWPFHQQHPTNILYSFVYLWPFVAQQSPRIKLLSLKQKWNITMQCCYQ